MFTDWRRYFLTIFFSLSFISACTIGVGLDTDGSAVLWKNRDQADYYTSTVEYINNSEDSVKFYQGWISSKFLSLAEI